jgi:hypothetical protein
VTGPHGSVDGRGGAGLDVAGGAATWPRVSVDATTATAVTAAADVSTAAAGITARRTPARRGRSSAGSTSAAAGAGRSSDRSAARRSSSVRMRQSFRDTAGSAVSSMRSVARAREAYDRTVLTAQPNASAISWSDSSP